MSAEWLSPEFTAAWTEHDTLADLLRLPREMAGVIVADDNPEVRTVVDIASGPGDFLAVMLDRLPDATGTWSDVSPAMAEIAHDRLDRFADRVTYTLADMTDLGGLPERADLIVTSRASHHLARPELHRFYADAAQRLAPGGWLVNLDHIGPNDEWNQRVRAARKRLVPRPSSKGAHSHPYPLPSIDDHVEGLAAAGLTDRAMPWRAFYTCLFMARRTS